MENKEEIVEEQTVEESTPVETVEESVPVETTEESTPAETVEESAPVETTEESTPAETVAATIDTAVKRSKKDIIGYNPETGEPIYKEIVPGEIPPKKNGKKIFIISFIVVFLVSAIVVGILFFMNKDDKNEDTKKESNTEVKKPDKKPKTDPEPVAAGDVVLGDYKVIKSSISDYDLFFLKIENGEKNLVYSPLSIKYALIMLNEGTDGDSHNQIKDIVGSYAPNKYVNSSNMSFANALFINNKDKNDIEENYSNTLRSKYNAEIVYDDFKNTTAINTWVKEKTLNLIDGIVDSIDEEQVFYLINALGIDMEWKNYFHQEDDWSVKYPHIKFYPRGVVGSKFGDPSMRFNNQDKNFASVELVAVVDNYDVVKTEGEDKIRQEVSEEYKAWIEKGACGKPEEELPVEQYLDKFINELSEPYNTTKNSTDFKIYTDDNVKAFAKDLKEYNGVTLEYVAIMPKNDTLKDYVNKVTSSDLSTIVSGLKEINNENFADGKITYIHGSLPVFEYEYQLQLIDDLKKLGVVDIFDDTKANLTKISKKGGLYINDASHKANISFTNKGIKAAAVTAIGGRGAAGCGFDHIYDVPVEDIDMTFDKPYLYMIIDKDSEEVWFVGTVYEPKELTYNY